ncbi:Homeodomain-interacting protein kinase 1 [Liparis tanakae]|uniref:Homeodomain-interacting protein kinase 1 n=1 Tax=Liparis tanakae TaxID=230148 RepID=A0A4Z2HCL9_9TELE|nr:Homeodomain-interacting protein kinase 1 [Liparis tanakae]
MEKLEVMVHDLIWEKGEMVSSLVALTMAEAPSNQNRVFIGDLLSSGNSSYLVESVLGQGTFGTVTKCRNIADDKTVAIKMMRNHGSLVEQARTEVDVLIQLQLLDSDKSNLVKWYQVFTCKQHICLEFEHLDKSLYDFMEERFFQPLLLREIRPIVKQEPYRLKVIDFGLAHEVSAATQGAYIQTLPYRSPEVILGLPYTEATDMWSVGCVAAALYLGFLLYPGSSEYDMMRYIVETQGHPADTLLTHGEKTACFYQQDGNSKNISWNFKMQLMESTTTADKVSESNDRLLFGDILSGMLELDAARRLTPRQVLQHQFTSMHHLSIRYHVSPYVRSCFETMDLCENRTTDTGKAVVGSSSGSAYSVQQNLPSASALSQPQGINPHPCSTTRTSGSLNSGMKRKVDDENEVMSETSHLSKRVRCRSLRAHYACHQDDDSNIIRRHLPAPSVSSSSNCFQPSFVGKIADEDASDNHQLSNHKMKRVRKTSAAPSTSSSSSCTSPSAKRKMADCDASDNHQLTNHKIKRIRKNFAAPSTSSSSRCLTRSAKRKMADCDAFDNQLLTNHKIKRVRKDSAAPPTGSEQSPL